MFRLVILTTGDEWVLKSFGELIFAVLDCYNGIDDTELLCDILTNLAKLGKGEITEFSTENDEGISVSKIS